VLPEKISSYFQDLRVISKPDGGIDILDPFILKWKRVSLLFCTLDCIARRVATRSLPDPEIPALKQLPNNDERLQPDWSLTSCEELSFEKPRGRRYA